MDSNVQSGVVELDVICGCSSLEEIQERGEGTSFLVSCPGYELAIREVFLSYSEVFTTQQNSK